MPTAQQLGNQIDSLMIQIDGANTEIDRCLQYYYKPEFGQYRDRLLYFYAEKNNLSKKLSSAVDNLRALGEDPKVPKSYLT